MRILVLDIGGSNVKLRVTGQEERTKIPSGPKYGPTQFQADLAAVSGGWKFEAVTVGFPSPVREGLIVEEPQNLGKGWCDFRFEEALGKPVRILNDAAMQAVGSYKGGRMLFLSLGTGLGSALIADHHVLELELCELRWSKSKRLEDVTGKAAMIAQGLAVWEKNVHGVVEMLRAAIRPEEVVIGGGGAKHLQRLPDGVRRGHNQDALEGGERLWTDSRFRI